MDVPGETYLVLLLATLASGGCAPKFNHFDVQPRHICPGTAVTVSWNVSGSAWITVGTDREQFVDDWGSMELRPTASTTVFLRSRRWILGRSVKVPKEIDVRTAEEPLSIGASTSDPSVRCADGVLSLVATPQRFDALLRVAKVSVYENVDRTYDVAHGGVVVRGLQPTQVSDAFDGGQIGGDWQLSTRLREGETCESPSLPKNLIITMQPRCP